MIFFHLSGAMYSLVTMHSGSGARQVGKTYSIISFGKKNYADYAYFNFEANGELRTVFDRNLEPKRIILELGAVLGRVITEQTLIIFDEIQAAP